MSISLSKVGTVGKAVVSLYVYVLMFCFRLRLKLDYKSVINFRFSLLATFSTSSAAHAPRYAGLGYASAGAQVATSSS